RAGPAVRSREVSARSRKSRARGGGGRHGGCHSSGGHPSAADDQRGAADIAGIVRSKEGDRRGNIPRLAEPRERGARANVLRRSLVLAQVTRRTSDDLAWGDAVADNAIATM